MTIFAVLATFLDPARENILCLKLFSHNVAQLKFYPPAKIWLYM